MNLTGIWEGEYSQLSGTTKPESHKWYSFEINLRDENGSINGEGQDISLENEQFTISGFHEDGVISFIKKYNRLIYQDEEGVTYGDEDYESVEIHYLGRFNKNENIFEGTWEIELAGEREGMQNSFDLEIDGGL